MAKLLAVICFDGFSARTLDVAIPPGALRCVQNMLSTLTEPSVVLMERVGLPSLLATSTSSEIAMRFNAEVGNRLIVSPVASNASLMSAAPSIDPIGSSHQSRYIRKGH